MRQFECQCTTLPHFIDTEIRGWLAEISLPYFFRISSLQKSSSLIIEADIFFRGFPS